MKVVNIIFEIPSGTHKIIYSYADEMLEISCDGESARIGNVAENFDYDEIFPDICEVLPDEINDIGAPYESLEILIINSFVLNKVNILTKLNNSTFIEDEEGYRIELSNGKVINFPSTGSEYFNFNLEEHLK